jgi:TIR domain
MENQFRRHIFICYAREDSVFVERLRGDLEQAGIPTWVDTRELLPGTPDWEGSIRQAISSSFAVLLVGSPAARDSRFVFAEFAVAQEKGVPVIPVWCRGQAWIECAPLDAARIQYIDLRAETYPASIDFLSGEVQRIIKNRRVKHGLIPDPFAGWYDYAQESPGFGGIPGYISVLLDRPPSGVPDDRRPRQEGMVAFYPDAYRSLSALLDDLYLNYLKEQFNPLSYGREWVLLEEMVSVEEFKTAHKPSWGINPKRLILPWEWLGNRLAREATSYAAYWGRSSLSNYGIFSGSLLSVRALLEDDIPDLSEYPIFGERAYGIAVNSKALYEEIFTQAGKQPHPPVSAGFLELVPYEQVDASKYKYITLVVDDWAGQPFANHVLRETNRKFDPNYDPCRHL